MFEWLKTTTVVHPDRWRGFAMALVLALTTIVFHWRLVLTDQYTWLDGADLARQVLPWYQFQASEVAAGRLPFWDPFAYGGQPLTGQAIPGTVNPLNWLVFLAPLNVNGWVRATTMHWFFVLLHFLAVFFGYLLCREWGATRWGAAVGGLVYGLGGFVGANRWPQMLSGAVWAPVVLLFVHRMWREDRPYWSAALAGSFLGLSILSGHHQAPMFVGVGIGFVLLWRCWANRRLASFGQAVLVGVGALAVGAPQILPAVEYAGRAYRWVNVDSGPVGPGEVVPYVVHEQFGLQLSSLPALVVPNYVSHVSLYIGVGGVVLGLLGAAKTPGARRWMCLSLCIGSIVFAASSTTAVHGILYSLAPMLEKARSPSMAVAVFHLGWAPLVALGADALGRASRRWTRSLVVSGGLVILGAWGVAYLQPAQAAPMSNLVAAGAAALGLAAMLGLRPGPRLAGLLVLVELGGGSAARMTHRTNRSAMSDLARLRDTAPIVDVLKGRPWGRVQVGEEVPINLGDWYGIEVWNAYLASVTANVWESRPSDVETMERFGVRYRVARESWSKWSRPVGEVGDLRIFENPDALGWAKAERDCGARTSREVLRREPDRVVVWVEMGCAGKLVVADAGDRGWRARVNGKDAGVVAEGGAMRGIVLERGGQVVEFGYEGGLERMGMMVMGVWMSGLVGAGLISARLRS